MGGNAVYLPIIINLFWEDSAMGKLIGKLMLGGHVSVIA
jgi:hypothetical protein